MMTREGISVLFRSFRGDFQFDVLTGGNLIPGDKIEYKAYDYYEEDDDYETIKSLVPKYMLAVRERGKDLHYVV